MLRVTFSRQRTPCVVLQNDVPVGHITKGRKWYCLYLNGMLFDEEGIASPSAHVAHNGCYCPRLFSEAQRKAVEVAGTIKLVPTGHRSRRK